MSLRYFRIYVQNQIAHTKFMFVPKLLSHLQNILTQLTKNIENINVATALIVKKILKSKPEKKDFTNFNRNLISSGRNYIEANAYTHNLR